MERKQRVMSEKDEYQLMLEKFPPGVIPDKNSAFVIYKGESDFSKAGSLCHGWSAMPIYYYNILS